MEKYIGVNYKPRTRKWVAILSVKGTDYNIGVFDTPRLGAIARDKMILRLGLPTKKLQILKHKKE